MKFISVLLALAMVLCGCSVVLAEDMNLIEQFEANPAAMNTVGYGSFSDDPDDAITDEELTRLLDFATSVGTAHRSTPEHFIVIRDVEEQKAIVKTIESIVKTDVVNEGTVTVLVLADTVKDAAHHKEPYNDVYMNMYYGIYDAGQALGYLNLGALSLGYRFRVFASLDLPIDGVVDINNLGNFEDVLADNWDIRKYMTSKDGTQTFGHTVSNYNGTGSKTIEADGNLTLLSICVIGKLEEGLDTVASATSSFKPKNYNFWDPQSGNYGMLYEGEVNGNIWDGFADGVYSGSGKSTSSEYKVDVTLADGKITGITIAEGRENMFSEASAMDAFMQEIVEAQSLDVDIVSGATQDCEGVVSAIREAFSK